MNDHSILRSTSIDVPATEDRLGISNYINGISEFILTCETPTTMSIQGEWGSGKSSMMRQIEAKLDQDEKVLNIWFDTWQFSQFSCADELPVIMLSRLALGIQKAYEKGHSGRNNGTGNKENTYQAINRTMKALLKAVSLIGTKAISKATGGLIDESAIHECAKALHPTGDDDKENNQKDLYSMIDELRKNFQDLVNGLDTVQKIVIYVDDLDRLVPGKAVELLEVLKIFLDIHKCVFLLAIDYDVVSRGIAEKYGFDMKDEKEAEKGKSFFDKIIQVPFTVPSAKYQIESYIYDFLTMEGEIENKKEYSKLIKNSIGSNPRSIKRIFNSFQLLKFTRAEDDQIDSYEKSVALFSQLCMQNAFPDLYHFILSNSNATIDTIFDNYKKLMEEKEDSSQDKIKNFIDQIKQIIKTGEAKKAFMDMFEISALTFATEKNMSAKIKRYANIQELYDNAGINIKLKYGLEKLQILDEWISSVDEEMEKEYKARCGQFLIAYNYRGRAVLEIYLNAASPTLEFKLGRLADHDQETMNIMEEYNVTPTKDNKNISLNVKKYKLNTPEGKKTIERLVSKILDNRK